MEIQKIDFIRSNHTDIIIGSDIIKEVIENKIPQLNSNRKCAIITNETVAKWYLEPLIKELENKKFTVVPIIIHDGEQFKNISTLTSIINSLSTNSFERNSLIIGLGGGVICDLTGFAASIYKRGTPLVFFPTTLLAMVDASYGGKNAVNMDNGKNLIGTVYQPKITCIDVNTLLTLPLSQISYGIVESLKHGLIADPAYYKYLSENIDAIRNYDLYVLHKTVRRSIYIKKRFIAKDELDLTGRRAHLNFGHTFAHALEACGNYLRLNHCEAVGLGMLMALKGSAFLGLIQEDDNYSESLKNTLKAFELPTSIPAEIKLQTLLHYMSNDKKKTSKGYNFILPTRLGKTQLTTISEDKLEEFVKAAIEI